MRYLVTPTFSEKVTAAGGDVLMSAGSALAKIEGADKEALITDALALAGTPEIYALRARDYRLLFTFGNDNEGEYALILDLIVHGHADRIRPFGSRDPRTNFAVDPMRNMMIDPRRNMMIDPRRNMMIDPKRNLMIDPRRNFAIDPRRNWQINPNRNSAWDGPLQYDLNKKLTGFLVRANEKVALLFDQDGVFLGPTITAGDKNLNIFDLAGNWEGYFVSNGAEGYNRFDTNGQWNAFLVGDPQIAAVAPA